MYFKERRDRWYVSDFKSTSSFTFEDDSVLSWKSRGRSNPPPTVNNDDFYLAHSEVDK